MVDGGLTPSVADGPSVVLVGAAHLDRVAASLGPFRPGCSNPGRLTERLGGAAFNAALALRAFGARAHLVSACGGDAVAERIGDALDRAGIGDGRIAWLDRRSATFTAMVDASGELIGGVADMEIYDRLLPRTLARRHLADRLAAADGLLIDANLSAASLRHLAHQQRDLPVAAIAVSPAKAPRLADALSRLAVLFASRAEMASLLGLAAEATDTDFVSAATRAGLRRAVATDGPRDVLVIDGEAAWRQTPPQVPQISDVVGAGDTLAGATFGTFLRNRPFAAAVRTGLVAAALRIGPGLDAASAAAAEDAADALPAPRPLSA
ncbi:PfkB family carbohydrate kinase [Aureimonas flava]|nr:PfkB family carbohydrate kinase [Aureimonas flava]